MQRSFIISVLAVSSGTVPESRSHCLRHSGSNGCPSLSLSKRHHQPIHDQHALHSIEFDWRTTVVGPDNKRLMFWVGCTQQADLSRVDNNTLSIGRARGCQLQ
jgi:hypothetical protein